MTFDPYQRRVKEEMSTDVVSVASTATLIEAMELMEQRGLSALPVVDENERCIGLVSTTDVLSAAQAVSTQLGKLAEVGEEVPASSIRALADNSALHQSVRSVMRFKLKSVSQETTIAKAGRNMLWSRFHHLPVVDDDQRLVGIVSTLDLLAAFVKAASDRSQQDGPHTRDQDTVVDLSDDTPAS